MWGVAAFLQGQKLSFLKKIQWVVLKISGLRCYNYSWCWRMGLLGCEFICIKSVLPHGTRQIPTGPHLVEWLGAKGWQLENFRIFALICVFGRIGKK